MKAFPCSGSVISACGPAVDRDAVATQAVQTYEAAFTETPVRPQLPPARRRPSKPQPMSTGT